jgi:hypothetical protein
MQSSLDDGSASRVLALLIPLSELAPFCFQARPELEIVGRVGRLRLLARLTRLPRAELGTCRTNTGHRMLQRMHTINRLPR